MLVCAWNRHIEEDRKSREQLGKEIEQHQRIGVKHQLKYWKRLCN